MKKTATHKIVWFCLINGCAWVWCSYILAYLGKIEIVESLSQLAITEIVAVVLLYCLKSLFEKTEKFGAVGSKKKTATRTRKKKEEKKDKIVEDPGFADASVAMGDTGDQLTV